MKQTNAKQEEWISVEDRLPETKFLNPPSNYYGSDWVLAACERGILIELAQWTGRVWLTSCDSQPREGITHWMPLPEPPNKLNKEPEVQASVARDDDSSTFADTINFLEKIDSSSMSDKTWLAEQKNLRQEGKELRERLTGKEIEEVKINYVASGRNSD